jgi:hypothetical protein
MSGECSIGDFTMLLINARIQKFARRIIDVCEAKPKGVRWLKEKIISGYEEKNG